MSNSFINIYYQNVHSLLGRVRRINNIVNSSSFHYILIFTETWLNDEITDNDLGWINFNIYRCDRSILTSSKFTGGGVIIAVRRELSATRLYFKCNNVEYCAVLIDFMDFNLILIAVYFPSASLVEFQSFFDCIEEYHSLES